MIVLNNKTLWLWLLWLLWLNSSGRLRKWAKLVGIRDVYNTQFFMMKYFFKYFKNICVFNEIYQNAISLCTPCLFLPYGAIAQNLVLLNTCNVLLPAKWPLLSTSTDYL